MKGYFICINKNQISIKSRTFKNLENKKTKIQYEYLVEKHVIKQSHPDYQLLLKYSHVANNIYNQGLYRVRKELFKGNWMNYNQLDKSFKRSRNNRDCMLYIQMPSVHLAQQILKLVCQNMTSWSKARKAFAVNPTKFLGRPKLPKYRKKGGLAPIYIDNQTARLRNNGIVEIPSMNNFRIKLQHQETTKIQQLRVIPCHNKFVVEIVYKTNQVIDYKPDNNRYLTIDPGLDNAFTLASNAKDFTPILINGRGIKSVNQYYNKVRSHLMKVHALSNQGYTSHRLDRLEFYRDQKINRFAHEASKCIVDIALSHDLNTIIIGKNKNQKQNSNMSKKTNQNFIGIPHAKMIEMITYKANLDGIVVITTNEAYTSQTSFLDNEDPVNTNGDKARLRKGISPAKRRVKRGLFKANDGRLINADVNGALQILKKVIPTAYANGIEGVGLHPIKLNLTF